jgi:hypothetical protein
MCTRNVFKMTYWRVVIDTAFILKFARTCDKSARGNVEERWSESPVNQNISTLPLCGICGGEVSVLPGLN